jgi:nicotinate-nucleotide adenylyltransferase
MRTGVLGGTFDPPHLGHLVLAAAARQQLDLDRVLLVVAGDPYRKAGRGVTPAETRLELVRALARDLDGIEVSDIEVRRTGPTYTVDTLEELARAGGEWWFLVGHDVLLDLPHWQAPQRIVELARLGVAERPPAELHVPEATRAAVPGIERCIDIVEMPALEVSSTDLRSRIASGRPTDVLLPRAVRALIDERGLYRDA